MAEIEKTFAIIKPDAVRAGKAEEIMQLIELNGFTIIAKQKMQLNRIRAEEFYGEHKGKPFFPNLVNFMTSGPIWALVLAKPGAILAWRALMGPTNVFTARAEKPKCLRALYGTDGTQNATHGSDSPASAAREIKFFFPQLSLDPVSEPAAAAEFITHKLQPTLAKALAALAREKPSADKFEAITFVANYLLSNNPNKPRVMLPDEWDPAILGDDEDDEDEFVNARPVQRPADGAAAADFDAMLASAKAGGTPQPPAQEFTYPDSQPGSRAATPQLAAPAAPLEARPPSKPPSANGVRPTSAGLRPPSANGEAVRPPSANGGEPRPPSATPDPRPPSATPDPRPPSATPEPHPPSATPEPHPPSATPELRPPSATPAPRPPSATGEARPPSAGVRPSSARPTSARPTSARPASGSASGRPPSAQQQPPIQEVSGDAGEEGEVDPAQLEEAATKVQAAFRGYQARKEVAVMRAEAGPSGAGESFQQEEGEAGAAAEAEAQAEAEPSGVAAEGSAAGVGVEFAPGVTEEMAAQAAVRVQAHMRGHLARRQVAALRAQQQELGGAGDSEAAVEAQPEATEGEAAGTSAELLELAPGVTEEMAAQAATRVQAHMRGHMARKQVAALRAQQQQEPGQEEQEAAGEGEGEGAGQGEPSGVDAGASYSMGESGMGEASMAAGEEEQGGEQTAGEEAQGDGGEGGEEVEAGAGEGEEQ